MNIPKLHWSNFALFFSTISSSWLPSLLYLFKRQPIKQYPKLNNTVLIMETTNSLKILMFPWLAYGHITPHLDLAKKLANRGFKIYICSTPINLTSIEKNIPKNYSLSIQLVELHLPNLPELPPHYHTTNGLPPHLNSTLKNALKMAKPRFHQILQNLKPNLVIHDVLQPWAKEAADSHNIPAVVLVTCSAAVCSFFFHPLKQPAVTEFPFKELYMTKTERQQIEQEIAKNAADKDHNSEEDVADPEVMLLCTSRVTEAKYIDYLSQISQTKYVLVGPPFQDPMNMSNQHLDHDDLIDWLGERDENSTVFVSFGSEYFLSKDDLEEIALGLELSGVNFIWVVRFPKGEDMKLEEALPKGFLERNKDKGRVVEGWAPQGRILSHSSIGGFLSHCGWNSVMESVDFGVPIIAIPMQLDQPINARMLVELGAAVEIVRDDESKVHREIVAQVIKSVIFEETGKKLKSRVRDISENLKLVRGEEMDAAAEEIKQLCMRSTLTL